MDIGREVRRYRAEPVTSPVPGEAPAPTEATPTDAAPAAPAQATEAPRTQEVAAEAPA